MDVGLDLRDAVPAAVLQDCADQPEERTKNDDKYRKSQEVSQDPFHIGGASAETGLVHPVDGVLHDVPPHLQKFAIHLRIETISLARQSRIFFSTLELFFGNRLRWL